MRRLTKCAARLLEVDIEGAPSSEHLVAAVPPAHLHAHRRPSTVASKIMPRLAEALAQRGRAPGERACRRRSRETRRRRLPLAEGAYRRRRHRHLERPRPRRGRSPRRPSPRTTVSKSPARKSGWWSTRSKKGSVVLIPRTLYSLTARRMRRIASRAAVAAGHELGDERVVVDGDRVALVDAAVVAHAGAARGRAGPGSGRGWEEARGPGPPRRRGTRSRGPAAPGPPGAKGSGSPCATRICSFTRSSPVTISVTGCSTCRRVFISRN